MCEKIFQVWDVFCLTISTVMFFLEKDTSCGVIKCGVCQIGRANPLDEFLPRSHLHFLQRLTTLTGAGPQVMSSCAKKYSRCGMFST